MPCGIVRLSIISEGGRGMHYPHLRMPGVHRLLQALLLLVAASSFLSLSPAKSFAATGAAPPPSDVEAEAEYARAAVTLDGEALFSVRGIQAYPAEKRAKAVGDRIRAVAADRAAPIESLRVVEKPYGSDILAGGRFLMSVLEADGAREAVPHRFLAQAIRQRIAEAIAAYRADAPWAPCS